MKKASIKYLSFLVFFIHFLLPVIAQDTEVIQVNEKLVIKSKVLNEERTALIRLPPNYKQQSNKYPVVYMLDGHASRISLMTGTVENLFAAEQAPEMIVVSIVNTNRLRDMTPSAVTEQRGSGGADNFRKFLETELITEVEKKYRTQPFRITVGHSLSGLFVMHTFSVQPNLFNAYLAASPALQWDDHYLLNKVEQMLNGKTDLRRTLYVGLGDEPEYLQGFNGYNALLKRLNIENLDYEFSYMKEENHTSLNAPVFHYGLRKVWADLIMPLPEHATESSLKQVESHYKKAAEKYGYTVPIPENLLNTLGYRLMGDGRNDAAIAVFEKNIQLYPASANTYDSYAEALEKTGQLAKAKLNLEKGLSLAEKGANEGLTKVIRDNLARVNKKLGN